MVAWDNRVTQPHDDPSFGTTLRRDLQAMPRALFAREPRTLVEQRARRIRGWIGLPIGLLLPFLNLAVLVEADSYGYPIPGGPWIALPLPAVLGFAAVFFWWTRPFGLACLLGWGLLLGLLAFTIGPLLSGGIP